MSISPSILLKKPSKTTGLSLVYLQIKWSGNRLLYSSKENIHPSAWDKKKQRVKNNQATTKDGQHYLNDLLSNMESVVVTAYRKEAVNGIPTVASVKKYLDEFFEKNTKQEKLDLSKPTLWQLIDMFLENKILHKGKPKKEGTIKNYIVAKNHLLKYQATVGGSELNYDSITLDFFYKWVSYLRSVGVTQNNSINKNVGVLKAFMAEAVDLGYTKNMEFKRKKFGISQQSVENVYLKDEEITILYNTDVSYNPKLENVKNAFVLASLTGLRYGDLASLTRDHVQAIGDKKYIVKDSLKTGEKVIIPLNEIVLSILDRYKDEKGVPEVPCNPVFNKQIKKVCDIAGLHEEGRLSTQPHLKLFECVSAHTARRAFATNAFIKGIPAATIMALTGHRNPQNLMKYLKLSKLDSANIFSKYEKMDKSKIALKVAN